MLVDAEGRGGSTLALQLLATSPEIAFDRVHPYERGWFRWMLSWAQVIDRTEWDADLWSNFVMFRQSIGDPTHGLVGPPPWRNRSLLGDESLAEACLGAVWQVFSARLEATSSPRPRYYAEKLNMSWSLDLPSTIPWRLLVVIRDPRDVWLSVLAFDEQRGFYGFGRHEGESEEGFLTRFLDGQRTRLSWAAGVQRAGRHPVIRYEDLVRDLHTAARRLESWLGVRLDPDAVLAQGPGRAQHVTAGSPEASVDRWRRELGDGMRERFKDALASELRTFDYEP